jgi:hypothetical protein
VGLGTKTYRNPFGKNHGHGLGHGHESRRQQTFEIDGPAIFSSQFTYTVHFPLEDAAKINTP